MKISLKKLYIIAAIIVVLVDVLCSKPRVPETQSYADNQLLDIYRAEGTNRPAMILIHGGAWHHDSRKDAADKAKMLMQRGITAISIDYPLTAKGAHWNDIKQDTLEAMWWVREHAKELDIDAERVCVMGVSSGGQLAGMLATTDEINANGTHSRPKCAITWAAPWNLTKEAVKDDYLNITINVLMNGADRKEASPFFNINAQTAPTMLIHGSLDTTVAVSQSIDVCNALKAAHVKCELLIFKNEAHMGGVSDKDNEKIYLDALDAFLKENL